MPDPRERAKSGFIEYGGNGLIASINYDARFLKTQDGFGYRIGLGAVLTDVFRARAGLTIPIGLNYLAGKKSHFFESGLGLTIDVDAGEVIFVPSIGYRYQPLHNGFTFRIFASPLIRHSSIFWAGLSFGYKF